MRTVINIKSGGSGRASGVVHSLFLLALLLGLCEPAQVAGECLHVDGHRLPSFRSGEGDGGAGG